MSPAKGRKATKQAVNYRRGSPGGDRCGTCSMYRPGFLPSDRLAGTGTCIHVRGMISKVMLCDDWERIT